METRKKISRAMGPEAGSGCPGGWFTIEGANLSDGKYQAAATPLPQQGRHDRDSELPDRSFELRRHRPDQSRNAPGYASGFGERGGHDKGRKQQERLCRLCLPCRRFSNMVQTGLSHKMRRPILSTLRTTRYQRAEAWCTSQAGAW